MNRKPICNVASISANSGEFNMVFRKIQAKKKSTLVAEQIIEAIQKGIYKVGDKLPPERQIVERTEVSRPSVREALSALQIVGVVESVSGDGTYVRQGVKNADMKFLARSILEKNRSPFEIWEARKILEPDVAGLAAEKAISEDIRTLKEILQLMNEMAERKDNREFLETDGKFHIALATATKNPTIEDVVKSIIQSITQELWVEIKKDSLSSEDHVRTSLFLHREILSAVENGDKRRARTTMKRHFNELEKYIFEDQRKID